MFILVFNISLLTLAASSPTKKKAGDKIVGGEEIGIKDAPFQVAAYFRGKFLCGGSIVDHDVIITAAHCIFTRNASDYSIRAGSSYIDEGGKIVEITSVIPNPNFTKTDIDYDVGIIHLAEPLAYSDEIQPIPMANVGDEIPDGADTSVTGWGQISEDSDVSHKLRKVVVQKVNDAECTEDYKLEQRTVTSRMVCAAVPEGGKSVCYGDSGGPFVYNNKLAGIVSWSKGCARRGFPAVYSKVAALRKWIDENIKLMKLDNPRNQY